MHELEINGTMYQFNFGIGFVREIDQTVSVSRNGVKEDVGLQVAIAGLLDGKVTTLETVLMTANKGQNPRLTTAALDSWIDNPSTDVDAVFDKVMVFLRSTNATRKATVQLEKQAAELMEQAKKAE